MGKIKCCLNHFPLGRSCARRLRCDADMVILSRNKNLVSVQQKELYDLLFMYKVTMKLFSKQLLTDHEGQDSRGCWWPQIAYISKIMGKLHTFPYSAQKMSEDKCTQLLRAVCLQWNFRFCRNSNICFYSESS